MNKFTKLSINAVAAVVVAFGISGCTSMQEMMASQMEVPTLEKQANRVATGMTIVRENNIMAYKMPISADAAWPAMVAADLNSTEQQQIGNKLMQDPYFATVHYSDPIQRRLMGSGALMSKFGDYGNVVAQLADQKISPMTYRAVQKIQIFYGKDPANWPNVFNFDDTLSNFLEFKDGTMQEVEAPTGDVYETIGEAVISLAPANLQKELDDARLEMLEAFQETAERKREKAQLETDIKRDEIHSQGGEDSKEDYEPLTASEKLDMTQQITLLATQIKEAESLADEKEAIYFQLMDSAVMALQSDINVDDESYVKLAKNLNIVADQIEVGANEAYTSFGAAIANIAANNIVMRFPRELRSLALAKTRVPANLQNKFNARIARLVKNAVYLLPNIAIGTYYAAKQASLAGKYKDITDVIVLAYETKLEQDKAVAEAAAEAEAEAAQTQATN